MTTVVGINAVFHDPAAAIVVDGRIVAAAEDERFTRRKHGKDPVPFSTWELPEHALRWCLAEAGVEPAAVDAFAYSYDPSLAPPCSEDLTAAGWEGLRTLFAARAAHFLRAALGLDELPTVVPVPMVGASGRRRSPGSCATESSRCSPRPRSPVRSGCCTRTSPSASGIGGAATSTR